MKEVEVKKNKLGLKIEIDDFPLMNTLDMEVLTVICVDIETRCTDFVKRRRSPKKGT